MGTEERKMDHIKICLEKTSMHSYKKSNGFEGLEFEHNALPEVDYDKIDLSTSFMGKPFRYPFFISAMTGGTGTAEKINKNLAKAAEELGIGMGLGSQRAAIENPDQIKTFQVREEAPNIFLLGNIGAVQLREYDVEKIKGIVDSVKADGIAIHLNPGQELLQPEGDKKWQGVYDKIKDLTSAVGFPVIAKETGCGISGSVAKRLEKAGIKAIDIAGAGGTNWIKIEFYRRMMNSDTKKFEGILEWGKPTAECLKECVDSKIKVPLIASGGMRTGLDAAKALAMGASIVGVAHPLLKPAMKSHKDVVDVFEKMITELKSAMFLTGSKDIEVLRKAKLNNISR